MTSIQGQEHEDPVKDGSKLQNMDNYDEHVTSEYLPELPPFLHAKMPEVKRVYSGCVRKHHKDVTLFLLDADLWQRFRKEGNEMIITNKGRRMFPVPSYVLCELDPNKLYDITLSINSMDPNVHKFCNGEWIPGMDCSRLFPTPVTGRSTYLHPFSPNTGLHWMREPISFSGLKISNNQEALGTIVLQSMRRYTMSLLISEVNGPMKVKITQPETTFIAVTQYQNEKVTQMKIEHNPFAKGFRFTGNKSKAKSKQQTSQTGGSDDKKNMDDDVSLNNISPLVSPLIQESPLALSSSRRETSDIIPFETKKLLEYLNEKREAFKHLLPTGLDHVKIGYPKQDQPTDPPIGGWQSPLMSTYGATYSLFELSGKSSNGCFMIGEANPLAQVRKFGELNRCSNMEMPLSLVKKKKTEEHTIVQENVSENSISHCVRHSTKCSKRFSAKNSVVDSTRKKFQTVHKDIDDAENTKANQVNIKIGQEKTVTSPQSRLSCFRNENFTGEKSINCNDSIWQHGESAPLERNIASLPSVSSSSLWVPTAPHNGWQPNTEASKHLEVAENCVSAGHINERRVLPSIKPEVSLKNGELWATTHEVVISSEGRPMFPQISLTVDKLDPDRQYQFGLKLLLSSNWFYDYSDHEWTPALEANGENKGAFYSDPDNPKTGRQWGANIVFDRLRLSTLKQGKNTVKLQLRRQYLPVVTVGTEGASWDYPLKDATFITVKIDRSPYLLSSLNISFPYSDFDRYHCPMLSVTRLLGKNLTRSAHRKQTNPKRRKTDVLFHDPQQA